MVGCRAGGTAAFLACHGEPETSSSRAATGEHCHDVLWMAAGRVSVPPRDGQLHAGHSLALLACRVLQLRPADLLRATRVRASCLQPLAAWHRHLPLAELLECLPAVRVDVASELVRQQLWSRRSVEAWPAST